MLRKVLGYLLVGIVGFTISNGFSTNKTKQEITTSKHIVRISQEEQLKDLARKILPKEDVERVDTLTIDIVNGELEDKYVNMKSDDKEFDNVLGFHDVSRDLVVLETNDPDIKGTFTHELGHFVDKTYVKGIVDYKHSTNKKFIKAFKKEGHKLYEEGSYPLTSIEEYFAQSFSDYVNKIDYSGLAPLTYEYIKGLF